MYGTTEIGVVLVNYPGATDFVVKPGSLGKPVPGGKRRGAGPERHALRARRRRRAEAVAPRRLGHDQGSRRVDEDGYFYPRRPRRRRDHLRRLDHERGRDRGHDAQASAMCRKPPRSACPTNCAARSSRPSSSATRAGDELRQGDAGPRAHAAESARISAPHRVRERAAARRRRARSTARFCASAKLRPAAAARPSPLTDRFTGETATMTDRLDADRPQFPKITEEGLDDLRQRIGVKISETAEPWSYEATRDNIRHYAHGIGDDNPLWCDPATRRRRSTAASSRCRASCSRPAASSRATSAACRACTPCGRAPTGPGTSRSAQRRDHDRGAPEGPDRARDALRRPRVPADLPRRLLQPEAATRSPSADSWCFRTERDEAREKGTKYTEVRARGVAPYHG